MATQTPRGGSIIGISSISALVGGGQQVHYTPTKAGVLSLMQSAACALGKHGIRCNALLPGTIRTQLNEADLANDEKRRYTEGRIPLGRTGEPRDLAGPAVFLASDLSGYVVSCVLDGEKWWLTRSRTERSSWSTAGCLSICSKLEFIKTFHNLHYFSLLSFGPTSPYASTAVPNHSASLCSSLNAYASSTPLTASTHARHARLSPGPRTLQTGQSLPNMRRGGSAKQRMATSSQGFMRASTWSAGNGADASCCGISENPPDSFM